MKPLTSFLYLLHDFGIKIVNDTDYDTGLSYVAMNWRDKILRRWSYKRELK